ncbi:MAG TPA: hypothetical protein DDZ36_11415 [Deltaproteobacteria bacterium]|nr:hypothetical protein [Deltaproteobacteria bacterium]
MTATFKVSKFNNFVIAELNFRSNTWSVPIKVVIYIADAGNKIVSHLNCLSQIIQNIFEI